MLLEMLEDFIDRRADLRRKVRVLTGKARHEVVTAIESLDQFLGEVKSSTMKLTGDPIADEWERMIEAGDIPEFLKDKKG